MVKACIVDCRMILDLTVRRKDQILRLSLSPMLDPFRTRLRLVRALLPRWPYLGYRARAINGDG